jgi:hypothetical protein
MPGPPMGPIMPWPIIRPGPAPGMPSAGAAWPGVARLAATASTSVPRVRRSGCRRAREAIVFMVNLSRWCCNASMLGPALVAGMGPR